MTKERQIEILKGRINQSKLEVKGKVNGGPANVMHVGMHVGMIKAYEDAIRIIEGKL